MRLFPNRVDEVEFAFLCLVRIWNPKEKPKPNAIEKNPFLPLNVFFSL